MVGGSVPAIGDFNAGLASGAPACVVQHGEIRTQAELGEALPVASVDAGSIPAASTTESPASGLSVVFGAATLALVTVLDPRIRELRSPLRRAMLAPLDPQCEVVQFQGLPGALDLARIAEFMEAYPNVALRAYAGYDGSIRDLEFLQHFPRLTRFHADALRYQDFASIDGLRFLPETLAELHLGRFKRRFSLRPLARFESLRRLHLEGAWRDVDVLGGLQALEDVTLRSLTLPDLAILRPLRRLRSLAIKLGGTRDLALLPELAPLAYLELWAIRGLEDIAPLGELHSLQFLFLQDLPRIDRLPDMARMTSLRRVELLNLRGLTDLSPLRAAPALEDLLVFESRHLGPEHFACLADHATLAHAAFGLGSTKKNDAVRRILDLPRPGEFVFR
jgi:hypothetical protein